MQATDLLERVVRLELVAVAGLVGGIVCVLGGQAWAWLLILGACLLLLVLIVLAAGLHRCRHEQAVSLILQGFENLPVAAVQRERKRLLASGFRAALAARYQDVVEQASGPPTVWTRRARRLFRPGVVGRALPDLLAVVRVLESEDVSARAVASAERTLFGASSPLYGLDVAALRAELRRVHDLPRG